MRLAEETVLVDGRYGVFEGLPRDQVVLGEYRELGVWAEDVVSLVVERLFGDAPGTLIDVGANLGLVVIPVVERTGALGIAFEPEPTNFELLTRNATRHGVAPRVERHRCACYSSQGTLDLALSESNLGDHRLQRDGGQASARSVVRVRTERLDDVLRGRELPQPVVLKLDVQGTELRVLQGARETLSRVDYVVTEYWPEGIVAHGDSAAQLELLLRDFPFGAVLRVLPLPEPLHSSEHVFSQLSWIAKDGSDTGFFDLLFSRHWVLPKGPDFLEPLRQALREAAARR